MADAINCPKCGMGFRFKPELVGRRTRCPGCGEVFRVQAPSAPPAWPEERPWDSGSEIPMAGWAEEAPPSPPVPQMPPPMYARPPRPPREPLRPMTDGERLVMKTGGGMLSFGVLALILPAFGLQFVKLQKLGDGAYGVAVGLIVVGLLVMGIVALRRYMRVFKWVAIIAGGGVLSLFALAVVVVVLYGPGSKRGVSKPAFNPPTPNANMPSRGRSSPSNAARPPDAHPWVDEPQAPQHTETHGGFGTDERPQPPARPRPIEPTQTADNTWPGYEGMVRQHGAQSVARVEITFTELRIHGDISKWYLDAFSGKRPSRFTATRDRTIYMVMAPIDDLDALAKKITFGTVTSIDKSERIIHVDGG